MSPIIVSRVLLGLLIVNEAFVVSRSKPGEIQTIDMPLYTKILAILFVVPFFFALDLPAWLGWAIVALQAVGLIMEVSSEVQLARARSFAISAGAGTEIQRGGMYRFLENPLYVGILIQLVAWSIWMPVVLIATVLLWQVVRGMVAKERDHLQKTLQATHRGIDSFLWN